MLRIRVLPCLALASILVAGCSDETADDGDGSSEAPANILYVAHDGTLVSYDLDTGAELPGTVPDVTKPVDIQVLADQTVLVNLTDRNEILAVDGATMLEKARIPSSSRGGQRPVHSFVLPERSGRKLWVTLNDGAEGDPATNSATFVDIDPASATYLQAVGEVALGIGHHKASFSATRDRAVITNIADCDNVMTVYDYSNLADIRPLATLTSADLGFDGSDFSTTCDPTYQTGQPPAPHGCATSATSGKAYCSATANGQMVVVDIDADPPTFTILETTGSGGGYTKALYGGGQLIYSLQEGPREGAEFNPGAPCQVGQLVVIDPTQDAVVREIPLFYEGPDCSRSLIGTDEETVNPGHLQITHDRATMVVTLGGGFGVDAARSRRVVLMDLADPSNPVQLPSIEVGASKSHAGDLCTGDGRTYGVVGNVDGNVTLIDAVKREKLRTITTGATPLTIAAFGGDIGPSHQTGPIE